MNDSPVVATQNLSRTFHTKKTGAVEAVRQLDLSVQKGTIVGLLGPNGAGKSTSMRMLTTLLRPSHGSATVLGHDLATEPVAIRRGIGYVAQGGCAVGEAIIGEELVLQARLFGLTRSDAAHATADALARLDLEGLERRPYRTLSGGQQRRMDIAAGLVHRPGLLFLDEPTTGLDPRSRANLWEHIRALRSRGTTVVLCTHYLDEADALCDQIMIMDHGSIVVEGTPTELKARLAGDIVAVTIDGAENAEHARDIATGAIHARQSWIDGEQVLLAVDSGESAILPVLRALEADQVALRSLSIKNPSLDDVFLQVTGRSLREADRAAASTSPVAA